jgi:hypothetical protein
MRVGRSGFVRQAHRLTSSLARRAHAENGHADGELNARTGATGQGARSVGQTSEAQDHFRRPRGRPDGPSANQGPVSPVHDVEAPSVAGTPGTHEKGMAQRKVYGRTIWLTFEPAPGFYPAAGDGLTGPGGGSWLHLSPCNWALVSMSITSPRPTDGSRSAGAAAVGRTPRWAANTSRTKSNWLALSHGSTHSHESAALRE